MSNDTEFNKSLDAQEEELARSHKAARRRNMLIWIFAVLSVLFGVVCLYLAMDNARLAAVNATYGQEQQQEKQSLAEEFDAACKSADFQQTSAGSNICEKAEQVASEPSAPMAGPQGIQGVPGPRGEQGFPGEAGPVGAKGEKGDKGDKGEQGLMGLLGLQGPNGSAGPDGPPGPVGPMGPAGPAGPAGEPGPAGADSTVPGPAGPTGADGATGPAGPQGEPGRGIQSATCGDDGRWTITYTDGIAQDGGTCRTTLLPPGQGNP